ncbi:FkbM family methyltransferase [Phenylobacterium sp.]|uniref:FkbM family methyltransferase n=1 Tax=Phenylobacterium sp. TaxID=1871053 RepID=UPI002C7B1CB7|nr:FkbM family methyltransferase [Phenylobacterium sp.]HLZ77167.1 FkbM family methyltransferase [Phenylobacterium sp.]
MTDAFLTPIPTRHGPMLALPGDQYVTRSLELYGEYCPEEWAALALLAKPGMTIVEVGANIGAHSIALARACAPGPIYLFEPQQRIFQILCANLALNGVTNAFAYPDACGEADGVALVPPIDYAASGNFGGVSVKAAEAGDVGIATRLRTIDGLELAHCHLIKADVEGLEEQVLRGAERTIRRCRPALYVENDRVGRQQALIDLITEYGYDLYWHAPRLFSQSNFNAIAENAFGTVGSLNMFCTPSELGTNVRGLERIDPGNWKSPVKLVR